jgi:hypothetical protein
MEAGMSNQGVSGVDVDLMAAEFARDGLVFVPGLMTGAQLAAAQRGVAWAMETQGGHKLIKARTYEWFREHPVFVELLEQPVVMGLCDRVFGDDCHVIAAQCSRNIKAGFYAPGADKFHNDAVFFPKPERMMMGVALENYSFSAMWYLQDTPLVMGPTQLVLGSHVEFEKTYGEEDVAGLEAKGRLYQEAMPAGSLLIFNNRTWHRGRPNETEQARDLITNVYALPAVEKVQLLTVMGDGTQRYVEPGGLLAEAGTSGRVKGFLRKRE